jgi:hypothetical protein
MVAALNARWEEFEAQDYEGLIALFLRTLDEPELMDGEMAFDMLSQLQQSTRKHKQPGRFTRLVGALRKRLPNVYKKEAPYLLSEIIDNTIRTGRLDKLDRWGKRLAVTAGRNIDLFNPKLAGRNHS